MKLKQFDLVPVDQVQIDLSVRLVRKHALRSAGAIHIAGALGLSRELRMARPRLATADRPQAAAARSEGLKVVEL
jgi:hypothetical protein